MGIKTLRTLLIGLGDDNPNVVKTVEQAIIYHFTQDKILESLPELLSQKLSFRINIKTIIDSNTIIGVEMRNYLSNFMMILENSNI